MDSWFVVALVVVAAVTLVVAIVLVVRLLRMRSLIRSSRMPLPGRFAFWAAVIYGISPVDVLPDPIYLDDIGILLGAITYLGHLAKKHGIIGGRSAEPRIDQPTARGVGTKP
ncbi:YkvA family protein [Micromonospora sp. NBC_01699]|uniref:YkvA family protein n=1 Tax=Micromonospora sp. NBC_01699 TaxID=2975984 RepID=UPI002E2B9EAA|nr:YkvA family protein [Micromonospora sp. NBC_01699]